MDVLTKTIRPLFNQHVKPFMIFLTVGAIVGIVYFGLFTFCFEWLRLNYFLSASIAYGIALIVYFFGNRKFTFRKNNGNIPKQMMKFAIMIMMSLTITLLTLQMTVELFKLSPYIGLILSMIITTLLNYLLSQSWVFKDSIHSSLKKNKRIS